MMPGSTTLGLNSAYLLPGDGGDNPDSPAFARQPLPPWTDEGRTRPVHEPYQGWISPFGLLADGPLTVTRYVENVICHDYYASTHSHCVHLTLAAQCYFNDDFTTLCVPSWQVRDYAFRPYRWSEAAVQAAYATVAEGAPRAPSAVEIHDLAWIGSDDAERDPTPVESARVDEIHANWTAEAAALLAFGTGDTRPYRWHPGLHADENMAPSLSELLFGYDYTDAEAYNIGVQYAPYGPRPSDPNVRQHTPKCGQGFIAWRKCRDGALQAADWKIIANAIVNGGSEAENALVRRRARQACDIHVRKYVRLTRRNWRGGTDGKADQTIGKEQSKEYHIRCTWISGAAPEYPGGSTYPL